MKIRTIIPAVLAAAVITGCSKSDPETGTRIGAGTKTTAKIRLAQDVQGPAGRAAVNETATDDEKAIKGGAIYAFTSEGLMESVTAFSAIDPDDPTLEMECGVGERRFYAIVNPPADLGLPTEPPVPAMTIYDFEKVVYEALSVESLTDVTKGFFMTNLSHPAFETLEKDVTNDIDITIGRATAKLNVSYVADTKTNGEPNGTLRDVNYKLKSTAKYMYLTSVYDGSVFKTPKYGLAYDTDNFLISPSSETSKYVLAVDDADNCFYMTENAAPAGKLTRGSLTYVVIKGQYKPTNNYVDADGEQIAPPASAVTFWRKTEIDSEGEFVKFADEYSYSVKPDDADYDTDKYRFEKYEDGICYYPFVVRGSGTDVNDPASYNIVRNHLYKASIIVVNGPGWWSEDATDPRDDDEDLGGETDMVITFDVEDWTPGTPQEGGI